jgi:TRAP transporter TAXI family solute receptor
VRHFNRVLCGTAIAAVCQSCRASVPEKPVHRVIRLMSGEPSANQINEVTVNAFSSLPGVDLELHPSPGGITSARALQQGKADLALSGADVAYLAFAGQLEQSTGPFDQLRGIAVLPLNATHLIVRTRSGIRTIADLKGRHVSLGGPGSGGSLTARFILEAFGINSSLYRSDMIEFNEALRRIGQGQLDAMFVSLPFPDDRLRDAIRAGASVIPITGPAIKRLLRTYPFFKFVLIPRSSYPELPAIHTIGNDILLICRRDLDEPLVYEVTKRLFEGLSELTPYQGPPFDMDQAAATLIPLHDGAARFYREEELRR